MRGTIYIAVVLAAWSWFGVWIGALDMSSGLNVAALVAGNVVAGWYAWDTFFNDKE
jgi:hypothetical protein